MQGEGKREREGETSNSSVQLFLFFPSCFIFFFSFFFVSFRSLSFLFRVFFFRPPLLEVHAIVTRKCKMRMACSDAFVLVGRMMASPRSKPDLAVFCIDGTPLLLHCCICFLRREILFLRISVHFDRRDLNTSRLF